MSAKFKTLAPRVHDLLHVDAALLESASGNKASWVENAMAIAPVAVVRRGTSPPGMLAVGVRGASRSQRWAAFYPTTEVNKIYRPEELAQCKPSRVKRNELPAFAALELIKQRWDSHSLQWGPIGSLGFELAAGRPEVTTLSDLDLVLWANERLELSDARTLHSYTIGLVAALDIRVETPVCGFSLSEFIGKNSRRILLRYPSCVVLGDDPWSEVMIREALT